ncbi:MAG TPA: carboxypeptidase regulatory-like domain-containing protein, partial [Gemmatimonadaceae bacterium]|nr:carboxypeptidase regulatory-like domain-containing protein [Gemmatimonadaceae bacterium]
ESASPGVPALIVVDSGDQQVGVAGQHLPRPIVAAVVDGGSNRLAGVPVSFQIVKGTGHFDNGQPTLTLPTDSDGRAIATFTTGPDDGIANNVVTAQVDGQATGNPVAFTSSGWVAQDAAQTAISGLVVDNSNQPIPGVTLRVRDTAISTQADAQGLFRIAPAPVGTVKLIVDGSTAQRPGAWPDLEYDLTTVPGRDNTLGMPVYLLPLNEAEGLLVDETHGGTLTLAEVPGFSLQILPGSVTFPGGSRSGVVSATVVHGDKVPMVPNFGQQPRLILTIQPPGARFDPPARMTLPNVEGLAPGQVTEMYSFDHDLGHFVSIGPATVSDDGATIVANLGAGIVKGGWHCCGYPKGTGAPNHCPECRMCNGADCVEDPAKAGKSCEKTSGKVCRKGDCVCAVPINFRVTKPGRDVGGGVLEFKYEWESSTGVLADLSSCQMKEQLLYPLDPNNPNIPQTFHWPLPWSGTDQSPSVGTLPATTGFFFDDHASHPNNGTLSPPYSNASFTVVQRYIYVCPCKNGGAPVEVWPKNPIVRTVSKNPNGSFRYTVTKDGASATINPLP